ncbi:MAG: hypothetical protein LBQ18_06400 [Campylobacteraceae bacterium]|jgi:hypothetical protein|nr:hypothetical protein [Campylobacteraceae bacterium]
MDHIFKQIIADLASNDVRGADAANLASMIYQANENYDAISAQERSELIENYVDLYWFHKMQKR